jgi:CheY-like chemotaxis protein
VEVAFDGPRALELAARFGPELALLDIGLPVMDGYELAGHLRRAARGRGLRLIAITGYGQEHDRDRAAAAGFDRHLVKPVDVEVLVRLIERGGLRTAPHEPPNGFD